MSKSSLIAVVGVCAVGKSTIVEILREKDYSAIEIAQEHAELPYLFARSNPEFVVYLTASDEVIQSRRKYLTGERLQTQRQLLSYASNCADVIIDSTGKSLEGVMDEILIALHEADIT